MLRPAAGGLTTPHFHQRVLRDRPIGELVGDSACAPEPSLDADSTTAEIVDAAAPDRAGVPAVIAPEDVAPEAIRVHLVCPDPRQEMHCCCSGHFRTHSLSSEQTWTEMCPVPAHSRQGSPDFAGTDSGRGMVLRQQKHSSCSDSRTMTKPHVLHFCPCGGNGMTSAVMATSPARCRVGQQRHRESPAQLEAS
jgi:hypothetical protein